MAFQVKTNLRTNTSKGLTNPSFIHLFSSKSTPAEPNDRDNPSTPPSQSSVSSYFSDIKASLRQPQQPASPSLPRKFVLSSASSTNSFQSKPSKDFLDELRKNLSEFRRKTSGPPLPTNDLGSAPPSSSPSSSPQNIPLQELFQRNALKNSDNSNVFSDSTKGRPGGEVSFQPILESLQYLNSSRSRQSERKIGDSMSLSAFKSSLKLKPSDSVGASSKMVIGGTERLPSSVFGREMMERSSTGSPTMKSKFVKSYSPVELGEKLRKLRPVDGGKSFSVAELNERLIKLRKMEEMEAASDPLNDIRESLMKISISAEEHDKQSSFQKLSILGKLGGTPNFMREPPKDQLVEKYFHPDNMSSTEKLKIELAKVRDDFKISESDCGSARVQVAQLTTKIKHLSSVLHKKDKHSRKGLLGMVQKRKKLLKYLRRTDWESYCFVLSKLGLRDNPDYKN